MIKPTAYITRMGLVRVRRKDGKGYFYKDVGKMWCDRHVRWITSRSGIAHSTGVGEEGWGMAYCGMWSGIQGDYPERFKRRCVRCCFHIGANPDGGLGEP